MPKIKTVREDVLRSDEIQEMFDRLKDHDILIGEYKVHDKGRERLQRFKIECRKTECLLALLWLFGKRISEVLSLKRREVWADDRYLYVRFHILKKKRRDKAVAESNVKRITLENPFTGYVVNYVTGINEPDAYLFPAKTRNRKIEVHQKLKDQEGKVKRVETYRYDRAGGFMNPTSAWKIVKHLNPKAYCHLFRRSLATTMAEEGATEDELLSWFDWSDKSADIAHEYVSRGTKLTAKWSRRKW